MTEREQRAFNETLLAWHDANGRDLPWRYEKDPYKIWVSEIMLQQTRAETVVGYYHRFLEAFPTVQVLANAPEQQVLKQWEGLGYYSRARNLHKAAQVVTQELGGRFPDSAAGLRKLPGIGEYTAGAVASIAFDRREAAVDGNEREGCFLAGQIAGLVNKEEPAADIVRELCEEAEMLLKGASRWVK